MIWRYTLKMLISSALLVASGHYVVGCEASPDFGDLDGTWKFEYSCAGTTDPYADRCAGGERDDFKMSIAHAGQKVCGGYETTAQLGNHVDDGDLGKWRFVPIGKGLYQVHFSLTGTCGEAIAQVKGENMTWQVIKVIKDQSFDNPVRWSFSPPHSAIPIRQNADQAAACKTNAAPYISLCND